MRSSVVSTNQACTYDAAMGGELEEPATVVTHVPPPDAVDAKGATTLEASSREEAEESHAVRPGDTRQFNDDTRHDATAAVAVSVAPEKHLSGREEGSLRQRHVQQQRLAESLTDALLDAQKEMGEEMEDERAEALSEDLSTPPNGAAEPWVTADAGGVMSYAGELMEPPPSPHHGPWGPTRQPVGDTPLELVADRVEKRMDPREADDPTGEGYRAGRDGGATHGPGGAAATPHTTVTERQCGDGGGGRQVCPGPNPSP